MDTNNFTNYYIHKSPSHQRSNENVSVSYRVQNTNHGNRIIRPDLCENLVNNRYIVTEVTDVASANQSYSNINGIPSVKKCLDTETNEEYLCKTTYGPYDKMLSAYFRLTSVDDMDGGDVGHDKENELLIRPVRKVLKSGHETFLLISPENFGDLHSYMRERRRLPEDEARSLFRQICQTVELCHDHGVVLRDLKLRRFIFTNNERTRLQCESIEDAVVLDDPEDDTLHEKIGCPTYVAPELLKINATYAGKAADIWSLGVILYTMLVGRYPFHDRNHSKLFAKITNGSFYLPGWLSSKARCFIRSLLRQKPEERMSSGDLLYHPWFKEDEENALFRLLDQEHNDGNDQCVPEIITSRETYYSDLR